MSVPAMPVDWGAIARAVHVLAVVVWIGGVSMVTTVLLPGMRRKAPEDWLREFDAIERKFVPQARLAVLLTGLSGLYMLYRYDLWSRFRSGGFWWLHLMVATWLLFSAALFAVEPLLLHHWVRKRGQVAPQATLTVMLWLHRALLVLSLVTIAAAVAGSHGVL